MPKPNKTARPAEMSDQEYLLTELSKVLPESEVALLENTSLDYLAGLLADGSERLWASLSSAYEMLDGSTNTISALQEIRFAANLVRENAGNALQALQMVAALQKAAGVLVEERNAAYEQGQQDGHAEGYDAGVQHYAECATCAENADIDALTEEILERVDSEGMEPDGAADEIVRTYTSKVNLALRAAEEIIQDELASTDYPYDGFFDARFADEEDTEDGEGA